MDPRSNINLSYDESEFEDSITNEIFFNAVETACCTNLLEKDTVKKLNNENAPCPFCRGELAPANELPEAGSFYMDNVVGKMLEENPELYESVHFNIDDFANVITNDELKSKIGKRYIRVLENTHKLLNKKTDEGDLAGKSPIELLASTPMGRNLIRGNKKLQQHILDTNHELLINGKTLSAWLSLPNEELAHLPKKHEKKIQPQQPAHQQRFFTHRQPRPNQQEQEENTWKFIVYGNAIGLKDTVEAHPHLLLQKASVIDYSGKQITNVTPLQTAFCTGDVNMSMMLRDIIQDVYSETASTKLKEQYKAIFPKGYRNHIRQQQKDTFDFKPIINAITKATKDDLEVALSKRHNQSSLCFALDEFRSFFTEMSRNEKVFNPYHMLKAFHHFIANHSNWGENAQAKRDLFLRQVIGFTQRLLPANYAQAFAQGIYYIMNDGETLKRSFNFSHDTGSLDLNDNTPTGLGFDYAICGAGLRTTSLSGASMHSRLDCIEQFIDNRNALIESIEEQLTQPRSQACRIM